MGAMAVITRFISQIIVSIINFNRMDVCVMPSAFANFDPGFRVFYALVCLDHRLHNPPMRMFLMLLQTKRLGLPSKSRRARNRWWLYVMLHQNPSLRKFRKHLNRAIN